MDITFSLQNGQYIAEFKVTSEFNLHIEKGVGSIQMFQRTSGTFFDKVEDFKMEKGDVVCDFDSGSFIGEKTIRLVSSVEPRYCFITTSGEVTEIKSQSKEVEVTSNGTMDITPDAGFSYLNSVKVKTNVQSGEGGGTASAWRYFSMAGLSASDKLQLVAMVMIAKGVNPQDNSIMIATPSAVSLLGADYDVFGFDANMRIVMSGMEMTLGESFENHPLKDKITEITEEEFYNLA